MRTSKVGGVTRLWLSARETSEWARRPGASWPCSQITGRPLYAEFDRHGDLIDYRLSGASMDVSCDEFDAITSDFLRAAYGPEHPAIRPKP